MKYEVGVGEQTRTIEIEKRDNGYLIRTADGPSRYYEVEHLDGIYNFLDNGKSYDICCLKHSDGVEVEVAGERHIIRVEDPRKKALKLVDSAGEGLIKTQMPGRITELCVARGEQVEQGQIVIIVEAMKMENPLKASRAGIVSEIFVDEGDLVEAKAKLVLIE